MSAADLPALPPAAVFARARDVLTTSHMVAEVFAKRHDHVLRDIEALISHAPDLGDGSAAWFRRFQVPHPAVAGRMDPAYELTKDGLVLLAMGFTGKRALRWKLLFIEAFNTMEAQLRAALPAPVPGELSAAEHQRIGGIVKAVAGKALEDRLKPIEDNLRRIASGIAGLPHELPDPRVAAVEARPMLEVLANLGVPPKGRRGIVVSASARLRRWAIDHDRAAAVRRSRETGKYVFHVDLIDAWLKAEGRALIAAHRARLEGQSVLAFRPKRQNIRTAKS